MNMTREEIITELDSLTEREQLSAEERARENALLAALDEMDEPERESMAFGYGSMNE